MAPGRLAGLELRTRERWLAVDEGVGVLPRQGSGREQVDGLAIATTLARAPFANVIESVARRDALAEFSS